MSTQGGSGDSRVFLANHSLIVWLLQSCIISIINRLSTLRQRRQKTSSSWPSAGARPGERWIFHTQCPKNTAAAREIRAEEDLCMRQNHEGQYRNRIGHYVPRDSHQRRFRHITTVIPFLISLVSPRKGFPKGARHQRRYRRQPPTRGPAVPGPGPVESASPPLTALRGPWRQKRCPPSSCESSRSTPPRGTARRIKHKLMKKTVRVTYPGAPPAHKARKSWLDRST